MRMNQKLLGNDNKDEEKSPHIGRKRNDNSHNALSINSRNEPIIDENNGQKESDGHVSLAKNPIYTTTLLVSSVITILISCTSYALYTQKQNTQFRIIYDISILTLVVLVIGICLIYFWEYLYEPIYLKMFPTDYKINSNQQQEKPRKRRCLDFNFGAVISEEVNQLQFSQNTISSFMCIIHQIFVAVLIWSGVINGSTDKSYIITGFVYFFEAFSITLPGFALTTFCEGRETINRKPKGSVITHVSYESKHLASQQSIFRDGGVVLALFCTLLVQFTIFITYPTLNHNNFKNLTFVMYNCHTTADCSSNPFFIVNELLFRLFVGITLLDATFLTLSNLLGDTVHHSSLKYIYRVMNPCIWPLLAIMWLCEIDVLYTKNNEDFENMIDYIWISIHVITMIMAICSITHVKNVFAQKLDTEIEQFYQMNKSKNKTAFIEGASIWFLYVIYYTFLFLSEDSEINWGVIRQGSILLFLTFEAMVIYYFKQCENHPKYRKYFMKYRMINNQRKKIRNINWIHILQWIAVLNLYDLINSFIFETSHFIELFDSANTFFQIAFSFSFAASHFEFWCLTMIIGILYRYYHAQINDHIRAHDASMVNPGRSIDIPSTNASDMNILPKQISNGSNMIKRQKLNRKKVKKNKDRIKKRTKSFELHNHNDVTVSEIHQMDKYDDYRHMISQHDDHSAVDSISKDGSAR